MGVDLDSVCGGRGICGRCQVVPSLGSFPKWAVEAGVEALSPAGDTEAAYRARTGRRGRVLEAPSRLGCAARILDDVVLDVPPLSQIHAAVVRKSIDLDGVTLDPLASLHVVSVTLPDLDERRGLAEIVADALSDEWSITTSRTDPGALTGLHDAVTAAAKAGRASGDGASGGGSAVNEAVVTVAVRRRHDGSAEISAVWPGIHLVPLGAAVDIGSTTIAGHLLDLSTGEVLASAGRMNPQIRLGEDLMSRVSYVMMNPGGDAELTGLVRAALAELLAELLAAAWPAEADAAPTLDHVLEIVLVGNPIMASIALGIDPTPLGQAPFTLATTSPVEVSGPALDLPCPAARVYVAPAVAGHVGGDTAAAILAAGPHRSESTQLLVDVGTNAEIVLGNRERIHAASSPTGPAFEGAQISSGQRATAGAVEAVRIDPETWAPRVRVIGCDLWSDEPGFDDAVTTVTGICGSGIIDVMAEMFLAGVISADGTIGPRVPVVDVGVIRDDSTVAFQPVVLRPDDEDRAQAEADSPAPAGNVVADGRTWSYVLYRPPPGRAGPTLTVTQNDVRAVQLAKAALRAGIDLLLEHSGIAAPDEVLLAGAFGAHIDPVRALVLGLVPDCPPERVRSVGNAAGTGAVRALLSAAQRREMEEVVRTIHKVETATEPRFQELFVDAMAIPHARAAAVHLSQVVALPGGADGGAGGEDGTGTRAADGSGSAAAARPRRRSGRRRARESRTPPTGTQ
ncbi:MAG TPA: drug:proton antiporter [Acidimicrobiaceae bacterium]|nr:drug:proton antiporter [Acidimicrobiaceae bacterium]HCB37755.1 drug:proton antiporter [Acidimicrobiaceae bacterium]